MSEIATFGAGCFWGIEEIFHQTRGVISTEVGYCGGTTKNPTYEDVYSGGTDHAESVQVTFDPAVISYESLLKIFFENHNPTQKNGQGPDIGREYRSVIFVHSDAQMKAAQKAKADLDASGTWKKPVVTDIEPAKPFYRAEEYHQRFLSKHGLRSCYI